MLAYKRQPNIRDLLVRAKLPPERKRMMARRRKVGFRRCQKKNRCRLCPYTGLAPGEVVGEVKITHSGEVIPIKSLLDCQTRESTVHSSVHQVSQAVSWWNIKDCRRKVCCTLGLGDTATLMSSTSHLKRSSPGTHLSEKPEKDSWSTNMI